MNRSRFAAHGTPIRRARHPWADDSGYAANGRRPGGQFSAAALRLSRKKVLLDGNPPAAPRTRADGLGGQSHGLPPQSRETVTADTPLTAARRPGDRPGAAPPRDQAGHRGVAQAGRWPRSRARLAPRGTRAVRSGRFTRTPDGSSAGGLRRPDLSRGRLVDRGPALVTPAAPGLVHQFAARRRGSRAAGAGPPRARHPSHRGTTRPVPEILYLHPSGDRVGEDGPVERQPPTRS